MDAIIQILRNEGYNISNDLISYYSMVDLWKKWWEGYVPSVHDYSQAILDGSIRTFKRYRMNMGKKVSEDWANLLLTNKTLINVDDETSQKYLAGDAVEQNEGVLGNNHFWENANLLVETAYAAGTGAFVLRVNEAELKGITLAGGKVKITYIDDAAMIYPLSWDKGEITECAFGSVKYINGKRHLYLEKHLLSQEGYHIVNEYYNYEQEKPVKVAVPEGLVEEFLIGCKLFYIIKPNLANNIYKNSPLGLSVYANSLDQLAACDIAYDNFVYDFVLGRKRVFMNQDIISMKDGKPNISETLENRLFYSMGQKMPDESQLFQEYNPALRITENKEGIQTALDILSANVGFGQSRYSFNDRTMTTATQSKLSNKDLTESVAKQRVMIEEVLKGLVKAILWLGRNIVGETVNEEAKVTITFDDSMFQDIDAEKAQFLQEIRDGIRQKWEYRVKYFGEDEATAKQMVQQDEEIEFPEAE